MKTPADKLRSITNWLDYQNESFNDRFKSVEDIIKAYEYCQKSDLVEFLDDLSFLDDEDFNKVVKELKELLGYSLY